MIVGALRVRFLIRDSRSLKDKRRVVHSIRDRLRNDFNASVAEIDSQDNRQLAVLGIAMIGTDSRQLASCLDHMIEVIRRHPVAQLLDYDREL
jgi:uncharacterized protein YlxP (DUF503 family)